MTEEIIIDGVDVAECPNYYKKDGSCMSGDCYCTLCIHSDCCYKQLKRLEQENEELSKLIRGTKDYAEVCSVCKDEVTIYPNISGRTDYTQNEVECRALAQIITRKNNLEQENKELGRKAFLAEQNVRTTATTFCEKDNKINELEQENKELLEKFDEAQDDIKSLTDATNYYFKENEELKNIINVKAFEINNYKLALKEIREKAQYCIKQDACALCDYSKECAIPDADGLVYDNNRLLIKLINEVLNE